MARLSQGLIQGLTRPAFGEGLMTGVAGGLSGMGAGRVLQDQQQQEQAARQRAGMLAGLTEIQPQGERVSREQKAKALEGMQQASSWNQFLVKNNAEDLIGMDPKTAKEILDKRTRGQGPFTPSEWASLSSKFTPESIRAKEAGTGELVPLPEKDEPKMSAHAQRLVEGGIPYGSEKFKEEMRKYNNNLNQQTVIQRESPRAQAEFLNDELRKDPIWEENQQRINKVRMAKSLSEQVKNGDSEAVRLLERTVSELYNSDSRAATEIDRFLTGKGISRSFADWAGTTLAGDITPQTKEIMYGIVEAAEGLSEEFNKEAVNRVTQSYGDFVDPSVIKRFKSTYGNETTLSPSAQRYLEGL